MGGAVEGVLARARFLYYTALVSSVTFIQILGEDLFGFVLLSVLFGIKT